MVLLHLVVQDELLEKIEKLCLKKQNGKKVSFKNSNAVRMEIAEMCEKG